MLTCLTCGFVNPKKENRCPECGRFYSKALELIEQTAQEEYAQSCRGQFERIVQSKDIKQALRLQWQYTMRHLTLKAKFTLLIIFVFVFALIIGVV